MSSSPQVLNVPNQVTAVRLVLAIVMFVILSWPFPHQYLAACIVFVIAASTDWVDGWYARKYNQVTQVGRIFDPFVDKVIICGAYIYLAAEYRGGSQIYPWMAVVVIGRELLITVIRSFLEQQGRDFSAKMSGKLKMVFQCAAVVASLLLLWTNQTPDQTPAWLPWTVIVLAWIAVISTVQSGLEYLLVASRVILKPSSSSA